MNIPSTVLAAIAASVMLASLAGCDGKTYIADRNGHYLSLQNDVLTVHADGQPDATVDAAGNLLIGGKSVAMSSDQRTLLKNYHDELVDIRRAGIETGEAGAKLAAHAVGDALSDAVNGSGASSSEKVNKQAKDVEANALLICDRMDSLQKTQDAIAASVPVFKPYASMSVRSDSDCRQSAKRHG